MGHPFLSFPLGGMHNQAIGSIRWKLHISSPFPSTTLLSQEVKESLPANTLVAAFQLALHTMACNFKFRGTRRICL